MLFMLFGFTPKGPPPLIAAEWGSGGEIEISAPEHDFDCVVELELTDGEVSEAWEVDLPEASSIEIDTTPPTSAFVAETVLILKFKATCTSAGDLVERVRLPGRVVRLTSSGGLEAVQQAEPTDNLIEIASPVGVWTVSNARPEINPSDATGREVTR